MMSLPRTEAAAHSSTPTQSVPEVGYLTVHLQVPSKERFPTELSELCECGFI